METPYKIYLHEVVDASGQHLGHDWNPQRVSEKDLCFISEEELMGWLKEKYAELSEQRGYDDDAFYWGQQILILKIMEYLKGEKIGNIYDNPELIKQ